jgi:hypothetical protein
MLDRQFLATLDTYELEKIFGRLPLPKSSKPKNMKL